MKKLAIALIIGGCLSVFSAGAAFAETGSSGQAAVGQETKSVDPLLQKQQEIDRYVFEEHAKDLEKQGFTVTNTGPMDGYVEIGITPYNDANAEYLYGIFGKDQVKVVEGVQAVTLNSAGASPSEADTGIQAATVKAEAASAPAAETKSLTDTGNANVMLYVVGGLVLLAALAFGVNKVRARKN